MIKFSGIGSAFNTEMGNTSAYIKEENVLLMIDCGSIVFKTIKENGLLEGVKDIHLIITHNHPDHTGSMVDLLFYAYYIRGIKVSVYYPDESFMKQFLTMYGAEVEIYKLISESIVEISAIKNKKIEVEFYETVHVPCLKSYAVIMTIGEEKIYYSGDAMTISEDILTSFNKGEIGRIYQDVADVKKGDFTVHMPLECLGEVISQNQRHKVYCMHFTNKDLVKKAEVAGFSVVKKEI